MSKLLANAKNSGPSMGSDDDLLIVDRVLAGDTQAFADLVRRHEQRVYRTTMSVTKNPEDAEDAAQETFLKAFHHLGQFQRGSRFTTWLTRIAINEGLQKLRKRRNTESLDELLVSDEEGLPMPRQVEDWHDNPEQLYARQEIRSFIEKAIESLPPAYRVVFMLRDVEELSTDETAEALGISVAAVKSRALRARLMMREALASRFGQRRSFSARIKLGQKMLTEALLRHFRRPLEQGKVVMLDCRQALAELSNYLDGEVSSELTGALERHLARCHRCSIVFDTTRRTLRIVSDVEPFEVPVEVGDRLFARLSDVLMKRDSGRG